MKRRLAILLVVVVFGIAVVMLLRKPSDDSIVISEETTYVEGPLREDGQGVDYFAALEENLYPDTMQTDDNGYRIIVRELGALGLDDIFFPEDEYDGRTRSEKIESLRVEYYEKLGLDPEIEPTTTYGGPFAYLDWYRTENGVSDDQYHENFNRYHRPWTGDDLPFMVDWVEENSPALDLIARSVEQPDFFVPLIRRGENICLSHSAWPIEVQPMRDFARGFSARANYRIGMGDINGAIDDVIACKRLGRRFSHIGGTLPGLMGIAKESIAGAVDLGLNENAPLTEEQILRIAQVWDEPPPRATLDDCMFVERIYMLELIQGLALGDYPLEMDGTEDSHFWKALTKRNPDWNDVMRRVNQHCSFEFGHPHEELEEWSGWKEWKSTRIYSLGQSRAELLADCLIYEALPYTLAMQEAIWRGECCDRIKALTLAMLLYEQREGELPPPFTVDADGNPLHSWRALLLPYLGQQELYDQLRIDEPWNTEHNRKFHDIDVPFFACPSSEAKTGETTYLVVVGENTAFHADRPEAGPKASLQILVVERQTPVCWMDPTQELTDRPPETERDNWINNDEDEWIGSNHPGGANFGMRSSGVHFFSETLPNETFQKLLDGTCLPEELP
jgi:hypothetical protein